MNTLDKIFVINLYKDTERLSKFTSQLSRNNWKFSRFDAITPDHSEYNNLKKKYISGKSLTSGEVGCALSHISLLEKCAYTEGLDRILIFEDDATTYVTGTEIDRLLKEHYHYLRHHNIPESDVLYLGKGQDKCGKLELVHDKVYRTFRPLCCHAYIVTKKGAKRLLSTKPFKQPYDFIAPNASDQNLVTLMAFHPSIYYQDILSTESNLRNMNKTFNNINECSCSDDLSVWFWIVVALLGITLIVLGIGCWKYFQVK